MSTTTLSRYDLRIISDWITPASKILDLGCGNGSLLKHLQNTKNTTGYGLELNPQKITQCIDNGVNVIQTNLDKGLTYFDDDSFDFVILSLTLQAMRNPDTLLEEMLRVGRQGIVTFPNFGYWRNRLQIAINGKMPVSGELPYKWYDTPNIHLCTIHDFENLCQQRGFTIESSIAVHHSGKTNPGLKVLPNWFGEIALCRFSKT
ncbi:MAG: methionine biosynthesis protein MetW [Gammaproteobacteria bacterium]|nr:methionine biosynthesis protein MetW [Gammaproteobacteria bacterium]